MYSGITQGLFPVVAAERIAAGLHYSVELSQALLVGLKVGASVSINGVCQTVVAIDQQRVSFDAIPATLAITTLNSLKAGDSVSVERSLKVGDEIGGHEVAGHVIGMGMIKQRAWQGKQLSLTIQCDPTWMPCILHKGFIAVDGSSLTVSNPRSEGEFDLHLIPETLRLTHFTAKQVGEPVNIELDHRTQAIVAAVHAYYNKYKETSCH